MVLWLAKSTPDTCEGPVAVEYRHRLKVWKGLKKSGDFSESSPILPRDKGIYGGMQGIWVDKTVTRSVSPDGCGITVGLLHTGDTYPDDLAADGLIYHYPNTARRSGRDLYEINATKNAGLLGLPVFVVTTTGPGKSLRNVQIGWVEDWSDSIGAFPIMFGKIGKPMECIARDPGRLFTPGVQPAPQETRTKKLGESVIRLGFNAFKRFGYKCAVCDIAILELLDVVRLKGKPREASRPDECGIVPCTLHHKAYEIGLFDVDPFTLRITTPFNGPDSDSLKIICSDLSRVLGHS